MTRNLKSAVIAASLLILLSWLTSPEVPKPTSSGSRSFPDISGFFGGSGNEDASESEDHTEEYHPPSMPDRVLVLSSVGRSGSTFLSELVSQNPGVLYFFEPEFFFEDYLNKEVTADNSLPHIQDMFDCIFRDEFIKWLHTRGIKNVYRTELTIECKNKYSCLRKDKLTENCHGKRVSVTKVIRVRLDWVQTLLKNKTLDLKVIHLLRDPRASLPSMITVNISGRHPSVACPRILHDIQMVPILQKEFPGKVMSVTYEELFADIFGTTLRIWDFLRETDSLAQPRPWKPEIQELIPPAWRYFIETHTMAADDGIFTTFRESNKEREAWRQEISEENLLEVEKHCAEVIIALGHRMFGSLAAVRDTSIPLKVSPWK